MNKRPKKKAQTPMLRLASLREAREAAHGDWHELTNLWSIQADIDWLLRVAEQARLTCQWAGAIGSGPIEELDADLEALSDVLLHLPGEKGCGHPLEDRGRFCTRYPGHNGVHQ